MTLLDVVQTILAEVDGDAVSSISDTVEATQIATLARTVYAELVTELDLPQRKYWRV